jgi:predicted transcriptional regulator
LLQQNSDRQLKAKIILLYLINQFSVPLTNQQLTDFVMEHELMNYFDLQQYLTDLVETSMLEYSASEGDDYYIITETGRISLDLFSDRVSQSLRRTINDSIDTKKKSFVIKTNVTADYTKEDDNDYEVHLTVKEGIYTLMDIKVNVVSNKHAKAICDNWEKKAQYLYADILNKLVDDTEF